MPINPLIPAKAGTQIIRRVCFPSLSPSRRIKGQSQLHTIWVPAFAGMSGRGTDQ